MKQDPINTGSYTLGLLVANTKNMADTQAQSNLMVGNYLKEGYNKLANAYALKLQQAQLDKENAFKEEGLNLQKQQITNQVQQWWDTKKQWAEQNKLEKQKMQESARVANLQFDLANRQLAYQKERDKPSIEMQQHQLDSLKEPNRHPLLQVPTTQDFGVAGRSAGINPTNGGSSGGGANGANGANAEVNFGIVGRNIAGVNTAGFGPTKNTANTALIDGGLYAKYMQSKMPQKDSSSNGWFNPTGELYKTYMQSKMPQKDSKKEAYPATKMLTDEFEKYFIPASKAKPQQTNTQEFLIPAYQAVLIKLDNNMPLTAQDKYVANLMGIKYDDEELRVRSADVGKNIDGFEFRISSLQELSKFIYYGEDQAGVLNMVKRGFHYGSLGIVPLNAENSRFAGADEMVNSSIAQGLAGGKPTDYDKKRAEKFSVLGKDKVEQRSSVIAPYERIIERAQGNINALEKKGYSKEIVDKMKKELLPYKRALEYLNNTIKTPSNFDYDEWAKISGIEVNANKDDQTIITYIK